MRLLKLVAFLALTMSAGMAAAVTYFDWTASISTDRTEIRAATINTDGIALVKECSVADKSCKWLIVVADICKDESDYPALGNAESGAQTLTIVCDGKSEGGKYRYIFSSWKAIEELIDKNKNLGIAVPMADGKFKVYRFSLKGAKEATALAEAVLLKMTNEKDDGKTGTITL